MISGQSPPLERVEQLAVLYDLASSVGRAGELDAIYRAAFLAIDRGLQAERASILLFDPDGVIRFRSWAGLSDEYRAATEGHSPWRPDHPNPTPVLVEDVLQDDSLAALSEVITREGIRALGFFPLVSYGRLLGKFMVYYPDPHSFSTDEVKMAELIAGHVASAIDRQMNEQALRASAEQFSKAFHASPVGLSIVRADDRRFLDANDAFLNLLGYSRDEVVGKTVSEVDIWAEGERDKATMMLVQQGFTHHKEARLRTKTGENRDILGSMEVITVGGETCVLSLVVDITDRRRAEDTLAFQKALLQAQSEASTDGILVVSPAGEMISHNRRFIEMWSIPEHVIESRSDQQAIESVLEQLFDPDAFTQRVEYLYSHPTEESRDRIDLRDGRVFERFSRPLAGNSGDYYGRVWYFRDITDLIRREERDALLAEAGAVLTSSLEPETILSSLAQLMVQRFADLVWVHVQEGDTLRRAAFAAADPAVAEPYSSIDPISAPARGADHPVVRVMRTRQSEMYTEMRDELLAQASRNDAHLALLKSLDVGCAIVVPIMAGDSPRGALTFARSSSTPRFTHYDVSVAEDLAARVALALDNAGHYEESLRMQQELRRLNEAKDEFLGMVSHELRTPITTIYGGARVLRDRPNLSEADRDEMLSDILDESERLRRLIEDLLVLARVELGEELLTEPLLLQVELPRQLETVKRRSPGRPVETDFEDALPPVLASVTYLEQVFRNLIANALKYSPGGSPIVLTAVNTGMEVVVGVSSRGAEVDAAEVERMFERFYRSQPAAERSAGAGIGLTVCKRLMEAQNGRIWAEPREGGGLTVYFALPVCME